MQFSAFGEFISVVLFLHLSEIYKLTSNYIVDCNRQNITTARPAVLGMRQGRCSVYQSREKLLSSSSKI